MRSLDLHAFEALCDDPGSKGEEVVRFIKSSLDLGHVAFMILKHPKAIIFGGNYGFSTYDPEWVELYMRNQYWAVDPAVSLGFVRGSAFDWSEADQTPELERFWDAAGKFGIQPQGITIPIHGPNGETSIFSVCVSDRVEHDDWWQALRTHLIRELMPIANKVQQKAFTEVGIVDDPTPFVFLTEPKREVLYWASQGKTASETAAILEISERTAREHREGILKQLNCVSITQAVAEALKTGLIGTSPAQNS